MCSIRLVPIQVVFSRKAPVSAGWMNAHGGSWDSLGRGWIEEVNTVFSKRSYGKSLALIQGPVNCGALDMLGDSVTLFCIWM